MNGIINNALTNNLVPFGNTMIPFTSFTIIIGMISALSFWVLLSILLTLIYYNCWLRTSEKKNFKLFGCFPCCARNKSKKKDFENSRRLINRAADTPQVKDKKRFYCLPFEESTNVVVSGLILLLLPATFVLFILAQFTPAVTATVTLTNAAGAVTNANTFDISLWQFVILLDGNGARSLGIFLLIVSGVWPLFRLFVLFLIFLLPVSKTSGLLLGVRREMLMVFEHFAKWSFGYIYVILGIMATLSFMFLRNDNQTIALSFQIQMGFAMYLVALFTSYVVTYLILSVNRRSLLVVAQKDLEDKEKISLSNIFFSKRLRIMGPLIVFLVFMVSFILILFGINLNGLFTTYTGNLQLLTQGQLMNKQFTYFNLVNNFVTPNPVTAAIIKAVQALYYIVAIGLPVIHLILLAALWVVPLSVSLQGSAFAGTEILSAWSSLEVLLVSFVVLLGQLPIVAQLVTGNACVALANLITAAGGQMGAACLTVATKVDVGTILSFVGAFLYVLAANIILRIGDYVIRYRISGGIETERRKVAPEDSIGSEADYGTPPEESYESAQSSYGNSKSRSSRYR